MFLFDIWEVWILGSALCPEELAMLWEKQFKEKWQSFMVFTVNIKTGDFLDPRVSCDPENIVSPHLGNLLTVVSSKSYHWLLNPNLLGRASIINYLVNLADTYWCLLDA